MTDRTTLRIRGERLKYAKLLGVQGIDYRAELNDWLADVGLYLLEAGKVFARKEKRTAALKMKTIPDPSDASRYGLFIDLIMKEAEI